MKKHPEQQWYKSKGDIYSIPLKRDFYRFVEFINVSNSQVTIRKIRICRIYCNFGIGGFIDLTISPFKLDIFMSIWRSFFQNKGRFCKNPQKMSIEWNEHSFNCIMAILDYLDTEHGEKFPDTMRNELLNINAFRHGKHVYSQHAIPLFTPEISPNNAIIYLFKKYEDERQHGKVTSSLELEKNLKEILVAGEDPNQNNPMNDFADETPLSLLFIHMKHVPENREMLFLLLFSYGASLWMPIHKESGYSLVEFFKYLKTGEDFSWWEKWMQSPVYLKKVSNIRVNGIDLISTKNSIFTTISLNSGILWSELKAMKDLEHEERRELFPLYSQTFHSENGNILAFFEHAFSPATGKMIDILRNQDGKIIGANVFILNVHEQSILVYIDLSFLHPDYRGTGIMPLIDFRIPFALQCLFGEHPIAILFLSLPTNCFAIRKVENTIFFPKYQANNMVDHIKSAFSVVYDPLQWKRTPDGIYWTVREEEQISGTSVTQKMQTPLEVFYYTQLCGSGDGYVPVMVPAGIQMLQNIHDLLAPRQVNFLAHCRELAVLLSETKILTDINPAFENKKPSNCIYESRELFWNKKRIPVPETELNKSFSQPEMRHTMHARF